MHNSYVHYIDNKERRVISLNSVNSFERRHIVSRWAREIMIAEETKGPFYLHGSTLIPVWISKLSEVWDNYLSIPDAPFKFGNGYVVHLTLLGWMALLIHAGKNVTACSCTTGREYHRE